MMTYLGLLVGFLLGFAIALITLAFLTMEGGDGWGSSRRSGR
jgi:hypothetical protein